jgi:hypothetical protein
MAEIAIVRRAADHDLMISLTQDECTKLFNGSKLPGHVGFVGNARQGIAIFPAAKHQRGMTRGLKETGMKRKQTKRGTGEIYPARVWLPCDRVGAVHQFRQHTKVNGVFENGCLILPPTPSSWYSSDIDEVVRKHDLVNEMVARAAAPTAAAPEPAAAEPEHPADEVDGDEFAALQASYHEQAAQLAAQTSQIAAQAERIAEQDAELTKLRSMGTDMPDRQTAVRDLQRLLQLLGEVNSLAPVCKVEFVVSGNKNFVEVHRVFRPGPRRTV